MRGFSKETAETRISRDVFIYDPYSKSFLVKKWDGPQHRVKNVKYGNAFGVFLCRPPKSQKDYHQQLEYAEPAKLGKHNVLSFNVKGVLGHKTKSVQQMIGRENKEFKYSDCSHITYVMPSKHECKTSSMSAGVTVLAYFLPVRKSAVHLSEGFRWISTKQATDPTYNIHAGVVSCFLYCKSFKDEKEFHTGDVASIYKRLHGS